MNSKSKIKHSRLACVAVVLLCALGVPAGAQQAKKIPRIGYLTATSPSGLAYRVKAFRQGLREVGYEEGKNIVIEWRYAEGNLERLPALAAELVRLNVDVIVTSGSTPTRPAKAATSTIPIVMSIDDDPVGNGFVASLAHPGGNITGLSLLAPELSGKQMEIVKEIVPALSRVGVFRTSARQGRPEAFRPIELAASAFGVKLQYFEVPASKDIEGAFRAAAKWRADAVIAMVAGFIMNSQPRTIVEFAVQSRLPAMYQRREMVQAGGLMSYGASETDLDRRAAVYVDKILKGAKPADLPVEQPTNFDLTINLKAAKQIGLTIPPNVLARADKVIK
jgi:putative ABC transport system substrate-binding protein